MKHYTLHVLCPEEKLELTDRAYVTGYEKRDHWGFKLSFWHGLIALRVLNPMVQVLCKKYWSQVELWPFICTRVDTPVLRKGTIFMIVWNKTNFYHDNVQHASTNVVVSILVSVYRHQQRVDTPTVHYYCILHTRLQATYDKYKLVPNSPISHSCMVTN